MPAGRPTKYKPEMCDLMIETFKEGHFIGSFCAKAGITRDTFHRWVRENKEFSDTYKAAREHGNEHYTKLLRLIAMGKIKGNVTAAIYLTKVGLKWRDDEVEVDEVDELEFYG